MPNSMRADSADKTIDCDYVDIGWAETPKGPRAIVRPHARGASIRPGAFALDLQAARGVALALERFVNEAEKASK